MSGNGYGSFDSVQAPVILITAFLRLVTSTTFGRSAQGCGGAGGTIGCWMPTWAEPRVGGAGEQPRARLDVALEQDVDREIVVDGRAQDAVEPRIVRRAL